MKNKIDYTGRKKRELIEQIVEKIIINKGYITSGAFSRKGYDKFIKYLTKKIGMDTSNTKLNNFRIIDCYGKKDIGSKKRTDYFNNGVVITYQSDLPRMGGKTLVKLRGTSTTELDNMENIIKKEVKKGLYKK